MTRLRITVEVDVAPVSMSALVLAECVVGRFNLHNGEDGFPDPDVTLLGAHWDEWPG